MKVIPRLLLIGAAILLPLSLGLWARSAASWRPQKIGTFPLSLPGTAPHLIDDMVHGPWVYESVDKVLNLDSGNEVVLPLDPHGDPNFSPDGRSLAIFTGHGTRLADGIEWRDCASGKLLRRFTKFRGDGEIEEYNVQFAPDNAHLLILRNNGVETIPLDGSKGRSAPLPKEKTFNFLSTDGKWLCSEFQGTEVSPTQWRIYDVRTGYLSQVIPHGRLIPALLDCGFSPDGSLLCFFDSNGPGGGSEGGWIGYVRSGAKLWDVSSSWFSPNLRFSPDSKSLLIFDDAPANPRFEIRAALSGKLVRASKLTKSFREAEFSPDGCYVYGMEESGTVWKIRVR